mgnify:CR=1 FL=1
MCHTLLGRYTEETDETTHYLVWSLFKLIETLKLLGTGL